MPLRSNPRSDARLQADPEVVSTVSLVTALPPELRSHVVALVHGDPVATLYGLWVCRCDRFFFFFFFFFFFSGPALILSNSHAAPLPPPYFPQVTTME